MAVETDKERDRQEMEASTANPNRFDDKKLFPGTDFEFVKPKLIDVGGFILCFAACFLIIWFAMFLAGIGA